MEERHEIYANGVLVEVIDTRTLAGEKARRLAILRERYAEIILTDYPAYKQQNAALGLYSAEETQALKDGIQAHRDTCNDKETTINACTTLTELDAFYD